MTLVGRYVAAVKRHLPPALQQDVGEELEGLLDDRVESEAERLGRAPDEAEIAELLRQHGHPYKVASGYLPQRALIGGGVFALYKRTLSRVTSVWLLVTVALGVYEIYRADGSFAFTAIPEFLHGTFDVLMALLFCLTLAFHGVGEVLDRSGVAWRWHPGQLPENDVVWLPLSMPRAIAGVLLAMSFLGLVVGAQHHALAPTGTFALGSGLPALLPVFHGIALGLLLMSLVALFQRHATRLRSYVWSALALSLAALLSWVVVAKRVLALQVEGVGETGAKFLAWWPEIVIKVVIALAVVVLVRAALRALRRARTPGLPVY